MPLIPQKPQEAAHKMSGTTPIPLSKRMRKATQTIHNVSDALVNMKLGLTLSDETVWSEGILTFSCIFKHLEQALDRNRDSLLGDLDVPGLRRNQEFDNILRFYFGESGWTTRFNEMRSSSAVSAYLDHLIETERKNPYLLTAYIYHLYMGLLSGGQILSLKRSVSKSKEGGDDIFHYQAPHTVQSIKKALKKATDDLVEHLDEDTQEQIVQEGIKVFELNNTLVNSVKGVNEAFWNLVQWCILAAVIVAIAVYIAINMLT